MKAISSKKYNVPERVDGLDGLLIRRKDIATEYLFMLEDVKYILEDGLATIYRCSDDGITPVGKSFSARLGKAVNK